MSVMPTTNARDVVRRDIARAAAREAPVSDTVVNGQPLPNIPWQPKPDGHAGVVWRYGANPIIGRSPFPTSNSVFNSAVVAFNG